MIYDVIIVGGSYAGMSAALQLLRARCQVLVIDAGQRRNRSANSSHGFLGQDGVDPAEIAQTARKQLEAYPTLTWIEGLAEFAIGEKDDFTVTLQTGETYLAKRLLFATGVSDTLADIEGLAERWGTSVFHCPYCHGYELNQGRVGVIANGPMSGHQAQLLCEWGDVTFLTNGASNLDPQMRQDLKQRGVTIDETVISRVGGDGDVCLDDGRQLAFAGLFTTSTNAPATSIAENLGCALMETPVGQQLRTNEAKETNIPGAFACGDTAHAPHSVALAVGDGAMCGVMLHRSLVWPES